MYTVKYNSNPLKELARLPKIMQKRIHEAIESLIENPIPAGCKKLKGQSNELYRIRIGDYRVVYSIHNGELIIIVLKIGHRKDVYKSL